MLKRQAGLDKGKEIERRHVAMSVVGLKSGNLALEEEDCIATLAIRMRLKMDDRWTHPTQEFVIIVLLDYYREQRAV